MENSERRNRCEYNALFRKRKNSQWWLWMEKKRINELFVYDDGIWQKARMLWCYGMELFSYCLYCLCAVCGKNKKRYVVVSTDTNCVCELDWRLYTIVITIAIEPWIHMKSWSMCIWKTLLLLYCFILPLFSVGLFFYFAFFFSVCSVSFSGFRCSTFEFERYF